ncbi:MAG: DNA-binding protein [Betaproteobacteria bacterium]
MKTHDEVVKALIERSGVRAEVERIEREEGQLLDALLKAKQEAVQTQAELVMRMRIQSTPMGDRTLSAE